MIIMMEIRPSSPRFSDKIMVKGIFHFKEMINNFFGKTILSKASVQYVPFINFISFSGFFFR